MGANGPAQTLDELERRADAVSMHRAPKDGRKKGLPAVKGDAHMPGHDADWNANRELEHQISELVSRIKKLDKDNKDENGEPLFILSWRLYPNKKNKHWQDAHAHHCGCGCAGTAPRRDHPRNRRK